jgi:hypothetical protein
VLRGPAPTPGEAPISAPCRGYPGLLEFFTPLVSVQFPLHRKPNLVLHTKSSLDPSRSAVLTILDIVRSSATAPPIRRVSDEADGEMCASRTISEQHLLIF